MKTFQEELTDLINRRSAENGSNTPDFILAEYLLEALRAFERATAARERWYGKTTDAQLSELPVSVCAAPADLPDDTLTRADEIEAAILEWLHEESLIDKDTQIAEDAPLSEIGMDSMYLAQLLADLDLQFGVVFPDSFSPKTYRELVDGAVGTITDKQDAA